MAKKERVKIPHKKINGFLVYRPDSRAKEMKFFVEAIKHGINAQQIADVWGISKQAIHQRALKFGIRFPRKSIPLKFCQICGKEYKSYRHDSIYCSQECAHKGRTKGPFQLICVGCGVAFERPRMNHIVSMRHKRVAGKPNEGYYCSHPCYIEHKKSKAKGDHV